MGFRASALPTWAVLVLAVACELCASLSLKAALLHPAFYLSVAVGYVASFLLLINLLKRGQPLGVTYGLWGALGVGGTALFSTLLFAEPLTGLMALGLGVIIAGVLMVELGSAPDRQPDATNDGRP